MFRKPICSLELIHLLSVPYPWKSSSCIFFPSSNDAFLFNIKSWFNPFALKSLNCSYSSAVGVTPASRHIWTVIVTNLQYRFWFSMCPNKLNCEGLASSTCCKELNGFLFALSNLLRCYIVTLNNYYLLEVKPLLVDSFFSVYLVIKHNQFGTVLHPPHQPTQNLSLFCNCPIQCLGNLPSPLYFFFNSISMVSFLLNIFSHLL